MDGVTVTPKAPTTDSRLPSTEVSVELTPIKDFLGVTNPSSKESSYIEYIRSQFGKDVPVSELLSQIKQIELKLGVPKLGETRLGKVYNYLRATQVIKDAEKRRMELLG